VCVCMVYYACIVRLVLFGYVDLHLQCVCVCIYIYIYIRMYVCMYACMHVWRRSAKQTHLQKVGEKSKQLVLNFDVHAKNSVQEDPKPGYVCVCVCVCVYVCMHVCV
jgi:hypothetical protein